MEQLTFFQDDRLCGFWLKRYNKYICNDCGFWYMDGSKTPYKYCPACGRLMLQSILVGGD